MNLLFGLFRFLTWGNIIVLAIFSVIMLMAAVVLPFAPILVMLMMFGTVIMHNVMCLRLQKGLRQPVVPMLPTFSIQLILMSVLAFIYGMYVIILAIQMQMVPDAEYIKNFEAQKIPGSTGATHQQLIAVMKVWMVLLGIHGAAIVVNCVLSSFYLNQWKKDHAVATEKNDEFLDI